MSDVKFPTVVIFAGVAFRHRFGGMRAGEHLLVRIPADAVDPQADAGVGHVGHGDRAVADLAGRAALTLLQDAVDEVRLMPVVVLRLVDERVAFLEVVPGELLEAIGHDDLSGPDADIALLRMPHRLPGNTILLIDLDDIDACAVRIDEIERELPWQSERCRGVRCHTSLSILPLPFPKYFWQSVPWDWEE